jgi:hypothetical protein
MLSKILNPQYNFPEDSDRYKVLEKALNSAQSTKLPGQLRELRARLQNVTLFMNCTAWGKLADDVCPNLYKGNAVFVHGELAPNTWTAEDGTKHDGVQLNVRDITYLTSKDQAEHTADDDIPY